MRRLLPNGLTLYTSPEGVQYFKVGNLPRGTRFKMLLSGREGVVVDKNAATTIVEMHTSKTVTINPDGGEAVTFTRKKSRARISPFTQVTIREERWTP